MKWIKDTLIAAILFATLLVLSERAYILWQSTIDNEIEILLDQKIEGSLRDGESHNDSSYAAK